MTKQNGVERVWEFFGSQRLLALFLTIVLVSSAGCSGFLGDSGGSDGADVVDSIPEGVEGVMHFDSGVIEDQTTVKLMDGLAEMGGEQIEQTPGPDSYEEALDQFEEETELSIDDFHSVTMFSTLENVEQEEYVGMIAQTDWTWEEIEKVSDEEIGDLEEDSYNGVTVYKSPEGMDEEAWVADFGDGMFAFGTPDVVRDTIDTHQGDAESFSGQLRDAYDGAADGYVKAAFMVPEEGVNEASNQAGVGAGMMPNPEVMTMTYYTDGDDMSFETQMTMPSEEAAQQIEQSVGEMSGSSAGMQQGPMGSLLESIDASQSGDTVTISFAMTPEEILTLLEQFQGMGMGMGGSSFGSVGQPIGIAG